MYEDIIGLPQMYIGPLLYLRMALLSYVGIQRSFLANVMQVRQNKNQNMFWMPYVWRYSTLEACKIYSLQELPYRLCAYEPLRPFHTTFVKGSVYKCVVRLFSHCLFTCMPVCARKTPNVYGKQMHRHQGSIREVHVGVAV